MKTEEIIALVLFLWLVFRQPAEGTSSVNLTITDPDPAWHGQPVGPDPAWQQASTVIEFGGTPLPDPVLLAQTKQLTFGPVSVHPQPAGRYNFEYRDANGQIWTGGIYSDTAEFYRKNPGSTILREIRLP